MANWKSLSCMAADEIIAEAIHKEHPLMRYYQGVIQEVGPEARQLMASLSL